MEFETFNNEYITQKSQYQSKYKYLHSILIYRYYSPSLLGVYTYYISYCRRSLDEWYWFTNECCEAYHFI